MVQPGGQECPPCHPCSPEQEAYGGSRPGIKQLGPRGNFQWARAWLWTVVGVVMLPFIQQVHPGTCAPGEPVCPLPCPAPWALCIPSPGQTLRPFVSSAHGATRPSRTSAGPRFPASSFQVWPQDCVSQWMRDRVLHFRANPGSLSLAVPVGTPRTSGEGRALDGGSQEPHGSSRRSPEWDVGDRSHCARHWGN